ncbi:MAG TPA: PD-(D/E)XK nuclease family protein [Casimicrobiaceae bacterium]|nr:PD-(D/E)XK nuclease family protein [Casimicrobiaceae bacterium]
MSDTIARVKPELQAALASGATAVTPNLRLARHLRRDFATNALARRHRTWATPTILPYGAWLESLWLDLLAADTASEPPRLLRPGQSLYAWQQIVAGDSRGAASIDARAAARLAAEAWELMHGWGAGGESWRGWPPTGLSEDQAAFVSWAESYAAMLSESRGVDTAQLADALVRHVSALAKSRSRRVLLVGFIEHSPQQLRLASALEAAGAARIEHVDPLPAKAGLAWRATGATPRAELARALSWARREIDARPDAVMGIAVADLSVRLNEARTLAEEMLCPGLQWPGLEAQPRPFNISLGDPLAQVPLVSTALELIELARSPLPVSRASAVLRSPYLVAARSLWTRRATLEARWLEQGRRDISLGEAIAALRDVDPMLAERWRRAKSGERLPGGASPRVWVEAWRDWLAQVGWPGDATLSSAEYQARRAWDDLLIEFGALAAIETRLARGEAVTLLRALAAEKIFQPEAPEARVQILGLLEAQGLVFDALWVAGLSAERWPPEAEPNALLPIFWQREHELPRSSAARELAYARTLSERFRRAAPRIVFSHAEGSEESASAPSALIIDLPALAPDDHPMPTTAAEVVHAAAPQLETVDDDAAPAAVPGQRMSGGAGLFEKQSDCPFRAVAIHRLGTDRWPEAPEGLSPLERGDLLHRAFAALWRDLRDRQTLAAQSHAALAMRVEAAVAHAIGSNAISALRWRALPPIVAALEAERLSKLMLDWLGKHELTRAPFRVVDTELKLSLAFAQLRIDLRLDRVDALEGGGVAIIDYKTGLVVPPARWFDQRPQAPQIALYAVAWRSARPYDPVRAVAYAQVKRGKLRLEGLAADATAWPELTRPAELREADVPDWRAVEARWYDSLGALADEIGRGYAAVMPRDARTCERCGLYALCRIGTPASDEPDTAAGDA